MKSASQPQKTSLPAAIRLLRPEQWVKNLFVFAALVFADELLDPASWLKTVGAFAAFCLLSSSLYSLNDIADAEVDSHHPDKQHRPLPAGEIKKTAAYLIAGVSFLAGAALCLTVSYQLLIIGLLLFALLLLYTYWFKHHMLLDVICIALGFVLRAFAGAVAIEVSVSPWLLSCTFTLCLFLGFAKRRCEVTSLAATEGNGSRYRRTLNHYTLPLLDQLLSITAGVSIVSYVLYTYAPATIDKFGTPYLFMSSIFVIYGIFRFAMLVEGGHIHEPTDAVLRDRPFQLCLTLWAAYCVLIVTKGPQIQQVVESIFGPLIH